ncbi:hypothetical protein ACQEU5_07375 [Marinactinospora thermotolerans]|uniref:PH domain-containing protein n=1 Tax=Marinactinospora thermotolerans DSM 45154 TaxID=1122192 RepID=A0A1T4R3A2_9ACTN|nr:hypothetical protein [Marinactinospora thermotolerans]SKA10453.1 hypothetical protein SAMN02745673_02478 [Marinactinospora thermotolerans DSM 45154]
MAETVRLVCPSGRKHAELWGGAAVVLLGIAVIVFGGSHWAGIVLGVLLLAAGAVSAWHGSRLRVPVLEVDAEEFRYTRGRYIVRLPFDEIGSYQLLPGRTRSLGLYDVTGRPQVFPSVEGRRTTRPYLPLTGLTSPARVEAFMRAAGIPTRDRSLTSGDGDNA